MIEKIPKNTITPEINYETEAFINITPKTETPTWASLAALTKNMSQSLNEALYQASYYANAGWGSTEVTGGQLTLTLTGDCKNGDIASDYILSEEVQYHFADARKTHMKLQRGAKYIIWPVTLANITAAYGDAGQPNALTVNIHGNGKPQLGEITV
ncbi:MAG: hypothetical protein RR875_00105 [Clostridium sp.]